MTNTATEVVPGRGLADRPPLLEVRGLAKGFGGVQALKGVDLDIRSGEVHGLVGANGAGKSTLIRHLAGLYQPDAGAILVDGRPVAIRDPQQANRLGLSFIHQELNLVPKFSALQNMTLGLPKPGYAGLIDWRPLRRDARAAARRLNIAFPLDRPVEGLSVAEQWLVSIGRALVWKARLIAMDEPTASLSAAESERLFRVIRELSADGIAILYVSHRLDEILDLCRRVTVFRDGQRVGTLEGAALTRAALIGGIVGGDMEPAARAIPAGNSADREAVLSVRGLRRAPAVRDVSFDLHEGEILGLAGLVGAGRTETVRLIFGADKPEAGEMVLDGRPLRPRNTYEAVRRGIALVPEERRREGLVLKQTVAFNMNITSLRALRPLPWLPLISRRRGRARAATMADALRVTPRRVDAIVGQLSGGNQQKVVMGKWMARDARVLILDEPTRGVDVGARAEIHKIIRGLADRGIGVIVISSEFEELLGCDRVVVMVEGRIVGELDGASIGDGAILQMIFAHQGSHVGTDTDRTETDERAHTHPLTVG